MKQYFNKEFLSKNRTILIKAAAILVIFVVAFVVFVIKNDKDEEAIYLNEADQKIETDGAAEKDQEGEAGEKIMVDVSGAVQKPSVVELPVESRIQDAIDAAGGLKDNADLSNINRAAFVNDGEKIIIPIVAKGENKEKQNLISQEMISGNTTDAAESERININNATEKELQTLTGIGPALADRIIAYREQNGGFRKIEEIKKVKGIGEKTFDKFKDKISI